jgi:hypothetical protein
MRRLWKGHGIIDKGAEANPSVFLLSSVELGM